MLFDTFIPKDTLVWGQIYSILKNDPSFEKPEKFHPDRFLTDDGKSLNKVGSKNKNNKIKERQF